MSDAPASEMVSAGKLVDPVLAAPHPGWHELEVAPAVSDLADRTWRALQGSMVGGNGDGRAELDALRAEYRGSTGQLRRSPGRRSSPLANLRRLTTFLANSPPMRPKSPHALSRPPV